MKIWHQSFTVLSDLGPYSDALKAHFARVARPDTQIDMHGMAPGTYSSNYPGSDIRHAALFHLHGMQFMQAGVLAQEQGYDAYAVSTLPDPTSINRLTPWLAIHSILSRHRTVPVT